MLAFRSRKLVQHGDSLYISLPVEWTRAHGLTKQNAVDVYVVDDGNALIVLREEDSEK